MSYYGKIAIAKLNEKEEKKNENFHYLGKTFSVTSGNFQQVRQQVQKAYWDKVKELEVKLRSAKGAEEQRIEKELREIREGYKETMESFDRFNNNKEEQENASFTVARKFTYKECLVTVIKKTDGKFSYIIEKDGHEEAKDKDFSTQDAAERDAKKEVDMVWNSDDEKNYYAKIVEQKH